MVNILRSNQKCLRWRTCTKSTWPGHSEQTRWSRVKNGGLWVCHYPGGNTGPQHNGPFIPFMFVQEIITQWGTILCSSRGTLTHSTRVTYLSLLLLCLVMFSSTAELVLEHCLWLSVQFIPESFYHQHEIPFDSKITF